MGWILQKGTKSIAILLRLCNFILCNRATEIIRKDEIFKVIFVLNLQFLGCKDIKCLDDQVFLARQRKLHNLSNIAMLFDSFLQNAVQLIKYNPSFD